MFFFSIFTRADVIYKVTNRNLILLLLTVELYIQFLLKFNKFLIDLETLSSSLSLQSPQHRKIFENFVKIQTYLILLVCQYFIGLDFISVVFYTT